MGGAATVLSVGRGRGRALALAALVAGLVVFGAVAASLPQLSEGGAIAVASVLVLPAFTATIWLALPLARVRNVWLLGGAALAGVAWVVFYFAGLGILANTSKLICFVLVGFWFLSLFEELWWLALVAFLVPWVDIWSVSAGPTRYVTEEQPGFFESISVALHVPGETSTANIGPPDIVFFALFLAAAQRFRVRIGLTWVAMTGFLSLTLVLVWIWDTSGLPALPAVCLGFLLPNLDLLLRNAREALRARASANS
ncbi:MAG: hypothetical protein WD380_08615 [Gaiellaceae bacterium]